ncbi:MAG: tRNA pseudouridine(13) synthase TruD [Thermoplasmata archaeon]
MIDEEYIGIGAYLSHTKGIGGKLKNRVEDFEVEELPISVPKDPEGKNLILLVKLNNWETNRFVNELSKRLRIGRNSITFAGTKDKRAISTQYFCIKNFENAVNIDLRDVEILDSFRTNISLDLGDLYGNKFKIKISECNPDPALIDATIAELKAGFPNFFGVQRFGSSRPITHIVGKYILQRDFENAVRHYVGMKFDYDKDTEARSYFFDTLDARGTLKMISETLDYEKVMLYHLSERPGDYRGAIAALPRTLKMMFIHGYQSYLFNKIITRRIKEYSIYEPMKGDVIIPVKDGYPDTDREIPVTSDNVETIKKRIEEKKAWISAVLYGYNSEFSGGEQGRIEKEVIEAENISKDMFKIKELPELSSKGFRRAMSENFKDLSYVTDSDFAVFNFYLNKGTYATSLLREFMKRDSIYFY